MLQSLTTAEPVTALPAVLKALSPSHMNLLLADASFLKAAAFLSREVTPDGRGYNGVDILDRVGRLPNQLIVVSSYVADFELGGRTVLFDTGGTMVHMREIDVEHDSQAAENSSKYAHYRLFSQYFEGASRARLDEHGYFQFIEGKDPNKRHIVIWESPRDRELMEQVNRIAEVHYGTRQLWDELDRQLYHKSYGEECIECFLQQDLAGTPLCSPVTVLTDDMQWRKVWNDQPLHTYNGLPVAMANIVTLLDDVTLHVKRANVLQDIGMRALRQEVLRALYITDINGRSVDPMALTTDDLIAKINENAVRMRAGTRVNAGGLNVTGCYAPGVVGPPPRSLLYAILKGVTPPAHTPEIGQAWGYRNATVTTEDGPVHISIARRIMPRLTPPDDTGEGAAGEGQWVARSANGDAAKETYDYTITIGCGEDRQTASFTRRFASTGEAAKYFASMESALRAHSVPPGDANATMVALKALLEPQFPVLEVA